MLLCLLLLGLAWPSLSTSAALANVTQHIEAPGQSLIKARQTLQDQTGHPWQIIAFRQRYPDRQDDFYLRLVGFPGVKSVDRQRSLTLSAASGISYSAIPDSGTSTLNQISTEPHVVQYNLQPVIEKLTPNSDWTLKIPLQHHSSESDLIGPSMGRSMDKPMGKLMGKSMGEPFINKRMTEAHQSAILNVPGYLIQEWQMAAQHR